MKEIMNAPFNFVPKTFADAMQYAEMTAKSNLCPKDFRGRPEDVFLAMQMGAEIGLKPIQALQGIAVINGRPSVWGDSAVALVLAHPECEYINEYKEGDTAVCKIKRKGRIEQEKKFGIEDAKKAGLWGKPGPWQQYPDRMLQMRARGFALRDVFADALKGLVLAEEAMDIPKEKEMGDAQVVQPEMSRADQIKQQLGLTSSSNEPPQMVSANEPPKRDYNIDEIIEKIMSSSNEEELRKNSSDIKKLDLLEVDKEHCNIAYKQRKAELNFRLEKD